MNWVCPTCQREFKLKNQWHSCASIDLNKHFRGKSAVVKETYDQLIREVERMGKITIFPVKTSIQVRASAVFLSIVAKKSHLDIGFQLENEQDEFPVYKTIRISRNRVIHYVMLESPDDIDNQLLRWLKRSYDLINGQ